MKCLVSGLLALLSGIVDAAPVYDIIYKTEVRTYSKDAVIEMVNSSLKIDPLSGEYSDVNVFVYTKPWGEEHYFVVNLLKPDTFGIVSCRLDVEGAQVKGLVPDYVEEEPLPADFCATCPDPELQMVFAYISDFPSTTFPAVEKAEAALKKAGIKYAKLKDAEENKQSVMNYLSCPKLVLWGRLAHGSSTAIQFGGKGKSGSLSAKELASDPLKSLLKGKFFPFNSCYVGGNRATFGKALISNGGKWMCGGDDVSIAAGSSEPVWAKFMIDISTGTEVKASFDKNMKNAKDRWRSHDDNTGPYHPFK